MMRFLIIVLINAFSLFIISNIVNGITIAKPETLAVAAVLLSFINVFLKPAIKLIMLPINILSLGVFTLFINAFLFYFVAKLVKGFYVNGFGSAFLGALLLSIIYVLIETFVIKRNVRILKHFDFDRNNSKYYGNNNVIDVEAVEEKNKDKEIEEK